MGTKKRTISVRLDAGAERRLERAAGLTRQSRAAFVQSAADERARRILLDWTLARQRTGLQSFSELAEETGLAVEEIMTAAGETGREQALEAFLASCRTLARQQDNPGLLPLAEAAVADLDPPG